MKPSVPSSRLETRDLGLLVLIALLALATAVFLALGTTAAAGPSYQDSPVSPVEEPSPIAETPVSLPTPAPTAEPTAAPTVEAMEPATTPATIEPPVPVPLLGAIMLVIGLIALAIVLRRG